MSRLINADILDSVVLRLNAKGAQITRSEYKLIDRVIFEFPTVDAEPVRHGKWTVTPLYTKCSECGESFMLIPQNYCPNCGAKMDK